MRIGSIVYDTNQGLGILAKDFYDHGIITDVVVVEHRRESQRWYPEAPRVSGRGTPEDLAKVLSLTNRCDAMLFFETAFYWEAILYCRDCGIPTFLMPMYECTPKELPAQPDWFICPSALDYKYYKGPRAVELPVPVEVPFRPRFKAEVFVHNAGWGGLKSRNGTGELLDAMRYVKSPITLILRSQAPLQWDCPDPRVRLEVGTIPRENLWTEGDVFVFPEKFNGLSLPLQEAYASGLMVMASRRFPMTEWLPWPPLIPVSKIQEDRVSPRCHAFDSAVLDPQEIARCIDYWYGKDISLYSELGRGYAEKNSWEVLGPEYQKILKRKVFS